jgi:hypothetical protein
MPNAQTVEIQSAAKVFGTFGAFRRKQDSYHTHTHARTHARTHAHTHAHTHALAGLLFFAKYAK